MEKNIKLSILEKIEWPALYNPGMKKTVVNILATSGPNLARHGLGTEKKNPQDNFAYLFMYRKRLVRP